MRPLPRVELHVDPSLSRSPPNQTKHTKPIQLQLERTNPTQKQNPCLFVRVSLLRLPTQHSTPGDLFKTKPLLCGFYLHSDRLLLVDYYYDSSTPTTSLKTPKSKSCGFLGDHSRVPCTGHFDANTPVSSRRKTPLAVRRAPPPAETAAA